MRTLFIDLGHSSRFPGASGFKTEVLWNRSIWATLKGLLNVQKWNLILVPESYGWKDWGSNQNLINRIKFINKNCKDGDWLLSIHGNGAINKDIRGVTTCYYGGSEYMRGRARNLSLEYLKATGVPLFGDGTFDDRTGRYGRIGMVRDTKPPALLIEAGFVTNKEDMTVDPKNAAKGIAIFFNLL